MSKSKVDVSRRSFLIGTAASGLGISLGFVVPFADAAT